MEVHVVIHGEIIIIMNKIISIALFLYLCLLISCKKTTNQIPQSIIDEIEQLSLTSDSLLSPSQLSNKISVYIILKETIKIDGNRLATTATVNDFKQRGLSKYYYYYYLNNIEEINLNMDYSPRNINEVYDELIQGLETKLNALTNDGIP
jgi:hypothetical protein